MRYMLGLMLVILALVPPVQAKVHLSMPDMRITDEVVEHDLALYNALQRRLEEVDVSKTRFGRYHRAKAQALLDFSWDEYHENDRTGAVENAFDYVQELLEELERGDHNISMKTRLLPGTRIVEKSLRNEAEAMKKQETFHCAQEPVAAMEVQLLWAGHEFDELGWRHTRKQKKAARELMQRAKKAMATCDVPPPPAATLPCIPASRICRQPVLPVMPPVVKKPAIPSHRTIVYFDLDKHQLQAKGPGTLNAALQFIRKYPDAYRIRIESHTDRLASDAYNMKLSQERAEQVKAYLVEHGVDADIIETAWYGERRPVVFCKDTDYHSHQALAACLQPNRRAEVLLYTPDGK